MNVKIIRSNRKTLAIQINPDLSVTVRAPMYAPQSDIEAYFKREDKKITVLITDYGIGIKDVAKSMQPLYSTLHTQERSGMGFTFMEAFADEVKVRSVPGKGTTVKLIKIIGEGEECGENL